MAAALGIVRLGNTEWLLLKFTPSVRTPHNVGASTAFTDPARRPSDTNMMTLRRGPGVPCAERTATTHAAQRAKSKGRWRRAKGGKRRAKGREQRARVRLLLALRSLL